MDFFVFIPTPKPLTYKTNQKQEKEKQEKIQKNQKTSQPLRRRSRQTLPRIRATRQLPDRNRRIL